MELEEKINMRKMRSKEEILTNISENVLFEDKECDTSDIHSMEVNELFYSKPSTRRTFLHSEEIQLSLHNEIVMFAMEIEDYNQKKKAIFKDLIDKMTEEIQKILPESLVDFLAERKF